MKPYTVRYKKIGAKRWFGSIERVKGDSFTSPGMRSFIQEDETRVELDCHGLMLEFGPERFDHIKKDMEKAAKQPLVTDDGRES